MSPIHDIVVIGASAGGLEALTRLIRALPGDLRSVIFVTVHFPATSPSNLPSILSREGKLPAIHPQANQEIEYGTIYIAPPDYHLIIRDGTVTVSHGPRENGFLPAIDPLFRSAAKSYGNRTFGILLSGMLDDGVFGLQEIRNTGGLAIVQDPEEATFDSMPLAALSSGAADRAYPVNSIAELIVENSNSPVDD